MKKRVTGKNGVVYTIDFFCYIKDGKTAVSIETPYSSKIHDLKVYYRHERTWGDHLGNTECGYYVIAPLPTGERKRVYMF